MARGWRPHSWRYHKKGWRPKRRSRWGLRRRLTFMFAFVALTAVSLTTWLTLGAVFEVQRALFEAAGPTYPDTSEHSWWNWSGHNEDTEEGMFGRGAFGSSRPDMDNVAYAPIREAFQQVTRTAFLAAFLSFLLASGVAAFATRFLTRPLRALTDGARRFEAGERGLRLELPRNRDELRSLTEAFNHLVTGLERQEVSQRNLVADIAHDLRTPLAVMRSELEGMQDGVVELDDAGLGRLHGEVMMLSRLVGDLRTLTLAEGGGLSLRREETQIRPLLERGAQAFGARAAQANVSLSLYLVDDALTAFIDPDRITQVLNNLLDNAVRYAAPGSVELGAKAEEEHVKVWVRDHGPGLSPDKLGRAFERFYRGDASRTRQKDGSGLGGGSGLGLSIAKALVEAHGGTLDARNHPEGGAVFTLVLPREV